jgi:hypothetical protein
MLAAVLGMAAATAGAQRSSSAASRTKIVVVQPVSSQAMLEPAFKITQRFSGATCVGSDTLEGASRCFPAHFVLDPCWPDAATTPASVVCPIDLWWRKLALIEHPRTSSRARTPARAATRI